MEDDIHAMLASIDEALGAAIPTRTSPPPAASWAKPDRPAVTRSPNQLPVCHMTDDDLDQMLLDIDADLDTAAPDAPLSTPGKGNSGFRKCTVVMLGQTPAACSNLRCTMCDHVVVRIVKREWDPSCDYFFFRNNVPDLTKLGRKLRDAPRSTAYACQCSWTTATNTVAITSSSPHKWVCAGHS
ncbi:unnamed protein product (mitochondrion) [Plasmodiophora brassicae]|uniref:Cilia- and flagella-associated protein 418 n=1 Tax=Plasmodiophora brassicae TaxID=37360 RepID=A0A0G4ILH0_PLABS|nr:hypothetical protein PBRA_004726 [Plasmodiophora brassicae]SPQ93418.1 unnamed protein product [Plasmodiophora brassicae]